MVVFRARRFRSVIVQCNFPVAFAFHAVPNLIKELSNLLARGFASVVQLSTIQICHRGHLCQLRYTVCELVDISARVAGFAVRQPLNGVGSVFPMQRLIRSVFTFDGEARHISVRKHSIRVAQIGRRIFSLLGGHPTAGCCVSFLDLPGCWRELSL